MKETASAHLTVLQEEAINAMVGDLQGHYVDTTYGLGGHTRMLLSKLGKDARVSVFDKDPQAIAAAQQLAQADARMQVVHSSFVALSDFPPHSISGILMDLGVSSPQLDQADRGFSFLRNGPLDMRMDNTRGPSVAQWLQDAPLAQIKKVIHEYGEERYAFPIAKAIVARREAQGPITGTSELAQIVATAVKTREPGKNPATRTFQAFRIFINAELEELRVALDASLQALAVGGRLVAIAFHSLEDRIVKRFIAENAKEAVDRKALFAPPKALSLRSLGRFRPSEQEVQDNPRARSAIMRVAERTDAFIQDVKLTEIRDFS